MSSTQEAGNISGAGPAHAMLRSPTVLIAAIGLWGMNVYFFQVFGIDFIKVLNHDLRKLEDQDAAEARGRAKGNAAVLSRKESEFSAGEESCAEQDDEEEAAIMTEPLEDTMSDEITAGRLVFLSITLLVLLHSTYAIWIDWLGGNSIGAVFAFYGAVTTAILFPLQSTRWLRHAATVVIFRAFELFNPRCHCRQSSGEGETVKIPRPIPFIDVFFADAMCSLSKVFFDWGMLLHMAVYYPHDVPATAWNIIIPSAFAAVPYFIRARQCLVMWSVTSLKNDPGRFQHLWNALKYSTSIFPLCLSAYKQTIPQEHSAKLEILLIILLVINAGYALWWDIVMDWGMMKNPSKAANVLCSPTASILPYSPVPTRDHIPTPLARTISSRDSPFSCWYALLRNRLRFGVSMSVLILMTDAVLRFSWTLRFYHKLFPSSDSFVLCTQFLEVFRRALWNLLRVEWENLKQSGQHITPKPQASPPALQMIPLGQRSVEADDEKSSFLVQRCTNGAAKITVEKNAEA